MIDGWEVFAHYGSWEYLYVQSGILFMAFFGSNGTFGFIFRGFGRKS